MTGVEELTNRGVTRQSGEYRGVITGCGVQDAVTLL